MSTNPPELYEQMCEATFAGYVCSCAVGHQGDHVAHGSDDPLDPQYVCAMWPQ